jgi:hypothetical protein
MMAEILIGEVEIISRLMPRSARVRNMSAATPGLERMPAPTMLTMAMPSSTWYSRASSSSTTRSSAPAAGRRSSTGTVTEMSE